MTLSERRRLSSIVLSRQQMQLDCITGWPIYMLFGNWERKNSMIQKAAVLKFSCQVASQLMHAEKKNLESQGILTGNTRCLSQFQ